jgi:hypothetical protein
MQVVDVRRATGRRSGPFLNYVSCRWFGRAAAWDFCHPLREPDSAGPVADRRPAADRTSDLVVDLAARAGFGSSWCFLSPTQRLAARARS